MTTYRWITLRLFWSLLLLIPASFVTLGLLHGFVQLGSSRLDPIIVAILFIALLPPVSYALTREGLRRFDFLHDRGKALVDAGQEEAVHEVFALILGVMRSGLLSRRRQESLRRHLLRSYFPFYAEHPEWAYFQQQLLAAMREGVRPVEAYHVLKAFVLHQKKLTLDVANLAEELVDYDPEDETLPAFFVQHFLAEKKTHYRAEYFYSRYLAKGGPLSEDILALCLPKVLAHARKDDFAAWCYVRAFDQARPEHAQVREALYRVWEEYRKLQRRDALSKQAALCASRLSAQEMAEWRAPQTIVRPRKTARQFWERRLYLGRQALWDLITFLRGQKKLLLLGGAGLAVLLSLLLFWPKGSRTNNSKAAAPTALPDTTHYFSLQVGALKTKRSAEARVNALQRRKLAAYVLEPQSSRGWYRIRVGKYPNAARARIAADSLKALGLIEDFFVTNYEGK
jgi:hypothetical protein